MKKKRGQNAKEANEEAKETNIEKLMKGEARRYEAERGSRHNTAPRTGLKASRYEGEEVAHENYWTRCRIQIPPLVPRVSRQKLGMNGCKAGRGIIGTVPMDEDQWHALQQKVLG